MTISPTGWLDWAEHWPGPADKVYSQGNSGKGIALHSMEGYGTGGITGRMMSTVRLPDGNYAPIAQASWMFSNMVDGTFYQHYPVTAATWTSGNRLANTTLWGCESEGVAGTPLNAAQVANMVRLASEFTAHSGSQASRTAPQTLWEHKEVWNWSQPTAGPTACPSGRYDTFYEALLKGEDDMTQDQFDKLFESAMGRYFPAYIEAYFANGFSIRNGVLEPGEAEDNGPLVFLRPGAQVFPAKSQPS